LTGFRVALPLEESGKEGEVGLRLEVWTAERQAVDVDCLSEESLRLSWIPKREFGLGGEAEGDGGVRVVGLMDVAVDREGARGEFAGGGGVGGTECEAGTGFQAASEDGGIGVEALFERSEGGAAQRGLGWSGMGMVSRCEDGPGEDFGMEGAADGGVGTDDFVEGGGELRTGVELVLDLGLEDAQGEGVTVAGSEDFGSDGQRFGYVLGGFGVSSVAEEETAQAEQGSEALGVVRT
jgi:hypothetical protein